MRQRRKLCVLLIAMILTGDMVFFSGAMPIVPMQSGFGGGEVQAAELESGEAEPQSTEKGPQATQTGPQNTTEPYPVSPVRPDLTPAATPGITPGATQSASTKLSLKNKGAKYASGGQKGIGYGKIKKQKIYHINTYVTDKVQLEVTKPSHYKVVGAANKKELRAKRVRVSSRGMVSCLEKRKGKEQYAVIEITAKETEETIYVYLYFAPAVYGKSPAKQVVYQGKSTLLKTSYRTKKLRFSSSRPKVARVNKKGVVTAVRKGNAVITAKVKGSEKNLVKFRILVREEPWLVSDKDKVYSYEDMTADLREIAQKYRGRASLKSLGTSEDGRTIWCLRIGNASAGHKLIINAGIHGREWLNPQMIMRKCEEILRQYPEYKSSLKSVGLYVVPMINPDGVTISQQGFDAIRSQKLRNLCKKAGNSARTWKGNARGVNLNFNFPSGWNPENKPKKPDGINFPGKKAASEKETKVMMKFVNSLSGVKGSLNYHSTGSILYWNYNVERDPGLYQRQKTLAAKINSFTRYRLMPKSPSTDPNGGFGDWLIYSRKIPNVTVETGSVMCPLPFSQFKKITNQNAEALEWFVKKHSF